MKPIKVLHVINVDKCNYYLSNLTEYSNSVEVEYAFVTFAPAECDFVRDFEARGLRVFALKTMGRGSYPKRFCKLWKLMRRENPDIVHTHLFDPSLIGMTVAKWQGRKTVLTRHHSDAVHKLLNPLKRRFYITLENYISRKADHIIAPSQMVRDVLVEIEDVASDKVTIIPYGQTTERFDAVTTEEVLTVRTELKMSGRLSLVNVSRLYHRKGHQYLFEAFAALINDGLDANLYLVGDGDFKSELEAMCVNLGIADRVNFLGWRNDALTIIAASDIVVHPSLEDALSSAVIEAVILEKPIVATDISGVRDSLGDGKYGEIVAPSDAAAFRRGIERILDDIDQAKTRAQMGRAFLLDYMAADRVASLYSEIYYSLLGADGPAA